MGSNRSKDTGIVRPQLRSDIVHSDQSKPEIVVNGKSMGWGMEGMARALGAMIGVPASRPAEDCAASDEEHQR